MTRDEALKKVTAEIDTLGQANAFLDAITPNQKTILETGAAKVTFEDFGQDFLVWTIKDRIVISCEPFQASVWCGTEVLSFPVVGKHLLVRTKRGNEMTVKYPLEKVEAVSGEKGARE